MTTSTPIPNIVLERLEERFAVPVVSSCPVCGEPREHVGWDAGNSIYRCRTRTGYDRTGAESADEYYRHYDASTFEAPTGSADVIALIEAYRALLKK